MVSLRGVVSCIAYYVPFPLSIASSNSSIIIRDVRQQKMGIIKKEIMREL